MSSGLPLLPVNPRVTNEANSCGKLSAAVVTDVLSEDSAAETD